MKETATKVENKITEKLTERRNKNYKNKLHETHNKHN